MNKIYAFVIITKGYIQQLLIYDLQQEKPQFDARRENI